METEQDGVTRQVLAARLSVLEEQSARLAAELADLRTTLATLSDRRDHRCRTTEAAEDAVTADPELGAALERAQTSQAAHSQWPGIRASSIEPSLQIAAEGGGVYIASGWGPGLYAESRTAPAVLASSLTGHGVHAVGGGVRGGLGRSSQPCGVFAEGGSGPGVYATSTETAVQGVSSTGYGASLAGGTAPLHLTPAAIAGAPMAGDHQPGTLYVDADAVLWLCVASGTPGTWRRIVVQ